MKNNMLDQLLHEFEYDDETQEKIKLFKIGKQELALESCKSICWSCSGAIEVFTKILFPYSSVDKWTPLNRKYYAMLSIDSLYDTKQANNIINFIDNIKNTENSFAPCKIRNVYSKTMCENTLANTCPHCNAHQGNFFIDELRIELIAYELEEKIPQFTLRKIDIDVDQKIVSLSLYEAESTPYMAYFDSALH